MNAHITKNNNISAGTVARTAVLGLALANQILSACCPLTAHSWSSG